jgi:hypothetical protein
LLKLASAAAGASEMRANRYNSMPKTQRKAKGQARVANREMYESRKLRVKGWRAEQWARSGGASG